MKTVLKSGMAGVYAAVLPCVTFLQVGEALAQETAKASTQLIEEVTVTARKREERVIDAPVAVSVMTAEDVELYNTRDLAQITQRVPGVEVTHGAGGAAGGNVTIRGVGKPPGTNDYGLDAPVSIVMDGMPFSRNHLLDTGFFDIQSVEILKGPQALYFGKNSPAGVIAIHSISPEVGGEVDGFIRTQYEFVAEDQVLEAGLSLPVGDHWAFRFALRGQDMKDGWLTNSAQPLDVSGLYPGFDFSSRGAGDDDKFPNQSQVVYRFTSVWEPTDNFDATFKMFRSYSKQNEAGYTILYSCIDGPGANPYYGFGFPDILNSPDPTQTCPDSRATLERNSALPPAEIANEHPFIDEDSRFHNTYSQYIYTLDMNWEVSDNFTLSSVTGFWDYKHREYTNYDYTSYAIVVSEQGESGEGWTQELRLQSNFDGPLNFMVGAFYEDLERDLDAPVQIIPAAYSFFGPGEIPYVGGQFPGDEIYDGAFINYHQHWDNKIESLSFFGSVSWQISDKWELSGGLRYTEEERSSVGGNLFENSLGFSPAGVFYEPSDKSDNVSPEVTLSFQLSDDVNVYWAYKTGFQSAGISNPGTVANLGALTFEEQTDALVFDETTVEGFEAGLKGYFLDGRMRADLAAFWYEIEDLQVAIFNSNTTTFTLQNAGVVHNWGFEATTIFQVNENLQLRFAGQYNDLEYDEWEDAGCHPVQLLEETGPGCHVGPNGVPIQDLSGVGYGGPPFQMNAGFTYKTPIVGDWGLQFTWDTVYKNKGKRALNQPGTEVPSRMLTHLGATISQRDGPWEAGLICTNCFNEIYVTDITNKPLTKIIPGEGGDMIGTIAPPRLVTFQLTYRL